MTPWADQSNRVPQQPNSKLAGGGQSQSEHEEISATLTPSNQPRLPKKVAKAQTAEYLMFWNTTPTWAESQRGHKLRRLGDTR